LTTTALLESPKGSYRSGNGRMEHITLMSIGPQARGKFGSQDDGRLQGVRQLVDNLT
jgi:hypothetical protein